MATATKVTPLTNSEEPSSAIRDTTEDVKFDWDKLVPVAIPKGDDAPFKSKSEADVPERIRHMVEQALGADEYFEVDIPDEQVRGAFVQWIRTYCYVRYARDEKGKVTSDKTSSGRLSSRVTVPKGTTKVRYSVFPFKPREKTSEPSNGSK